MSLRDIDQYQYDRKRIFTELLTSGNHYPGLKLRLRDTFNRFELEDLSHLFATIAAECRIAWITAEGKEDDDADENPEGIADEAGEEPDCPVSAEAKTGRAESADLNSGIDQPGPP